MPAGPSHDDQSRLGAPEHDCPSWCSTALHGDGSVVAHTLDIPCTVPGISIRLYQVDDVTDPTASIPASVELTIGAEVTVLRATEARTLIRRLGEAARTLDGNRHTWDTARTGHTC